MVPALTVRDLAVVLGGVRVLRDVNLEVEAGELVGLIGPNGAGKTTLMRSIMGLLTPAAGTVEVRGERVRPGRPHRAIGYVPQSRATQWGYPMSVEELVATGLERRGLLARARLGRSAWEKVYAALDRVDLFEMRRRPIGQLSGGQQQRILIARALVRDPAILLLDEPFTGLDHPTQDSLADLFLSLRAGGAGIIMSTHDLTQAVDISTRVALLNRTIIAAGPPADILRADLWMETFQVRASSPLLRVLGMVKA
ncbi:anchored repeat-type ABC transporter ATP-binding subunit [Actinotignum timonense]|nr:anchored repeat-type ABC transporter ATP-binding subunit [Actinotignum timonense]